jgi:hypothetical protein
MTNKKLGLLLLPLVPLSALGIVEIAGRIATPEPPVVEHHVAPVVVERPVVAPAPVTPAPPPPVAPVHPPGAAPSR